MELSNVKERDLVKFVANDDWKDLVGVVDKKVKEVLYIFSVSKPDYFYEVREDNKHAIIPFK